MKRFLKIYSATYEDAARVEDKGRGHKENGESIIQRNIEGDVQQKHYYVKAHLFGVTRNRTRRTTTCMFLIAPYCLVASKL